MTDGISRREVVALAGAGVALAGCSMGASEGASNRSGNSSARIKTVGDWGFNPAIDVPTGGGANYPPFKPKYISLLYLGLKSDWSIVTNHASYPVAQNTTDAQRLTKAVAAFKNVVGGRKRFRDSPGGLYQRTNGDLDSVAFDTFRFKSQNEIFIFLDQVDLPGGANTRLLLDAKRVLSFGPRLQVKDAQGNHMPAQENFSFFNAAAVDLQPYLADLGGRIPGALMRVRNYMTNENGAAIVIADQGYAMNIHFSVPGPGGIPIPMIIDPDTGNGTGNEP